MPDKRIALILCLISIIFIVVIAFYPSAKAGFTYWDDDRYVTDNTMIRELSLKNAVSLFRIIRDDAYKKNAFAKNMYIPFVHLSYAIEYHFFRLSPCVYHKTNLILHIFNTLLVFWLIMMLSGRRWISLIVALFFGVHPLHVESVAWISERKDLLYGFFFILSLVYYCYYIKDKIKYCYFLSLLFFLVSLMSKTMAITLPFVLLLVDYLKERDINKDRIKEKIPFFALSVIFVLIMVCSTDMSLTLGSENRPDYSVHNNIVTAGYSLLVYIYRMILPLKLSCLYPYADRKYQFLLLLIPFFEVLLFSIIYIITREKRGINFGLLFFLITILPVIQLIPIPPGLTPDRYTYIPSIGLFYIFALAVNSIYNRSGPSSLRKAAIIISILIIILSFTLLTWQRCLVWKNSETLWNDVITKYPRMITAYNNRGYFYYKNREYERAYDDYIKALKIDPASAKVYLNLGDLYYDNGKYDNAADCYTMALKNDNKMMTALINRGNAYRERKEYRRAINDYENALKTDMTLQNAYFNRGLLFLITKEYKKAIDDLNIAIEMEPCDFLAYINRGIAYHILHEYNKALEDYNKVLDIDRKNDSAYLNRANTYVELARLKEALEDYNTSIAYNPGNIEAVNCRMTLYLKMNEYERALNDLNILEQSGYPIKKGFKEEILNKIKARNEKI